MAKDLVFNLGANTASFQSAMRQAADSIKGIQTGIDAIKPAALIYLGQQALNAARQIREFAESGAKVKAIEESFHIIASNIGVSIDSLIGKMREATNATIDDSELMRKANKAMLEGFSPEQLIQIGEAARVAARITGTDVATSYDTITDAIVNLRERGLKTAGMIIDMEEAMRKHAATLGINKDQLNDYGKQMAVMNAVHEKTIELQGKLNIGTTNAYEAMQKQKSSMQELYETFAKVASADWGRITWFFESLAGSIIKTGQAIKWLHEQWMRLGGKLGMFDFTPPGYPTEREHAGFGPAMPGKSQIKVKESEYPEWRKVIGEERAQYEKEYWENQKKLWDIEDNLVKVEGERAQVLADEMYPAEDKINQMVIQGNIYYDDQSKKLQEIKNLITDFGWEDYAAGVDAANDLTRKLNVTMLQNTKAADQMRENAKAIDDAFKSFGDSISSGWSENMKDMIKGTETFGDAMKKMAQSMADAFISAITKMIANLILFGNISGKYSSGSGALGLIGKLLGGGVSAGVGAFAPVGGYQHGGIVTRPEIAMVGEAGPEAVIPLKNGKVPVEGGGGVTNYNTFIECVDADSFAKKYGNVIESIYYKGKRFNRMSMRD